MPTGSHARPLLLGHRGCRLPGFHENSIKSFQHALASGCDGFEFDVRLTADGRSVCVHDQAVGKYIVATTTYNELTKYHSRPERLDSAPGLCCLEEVLETFGKTAFLNIELKVSGLESQILESLKRKPPTQGYFVSSFLPEVICRLEELAPEVLGGTAQLGFLFDDIAGLKAWPNLQGPWVVPRHDLVTRELVQAVHAAGRKLATWTVNSPMEMVRLAEWGVDALISDDPALLSRTVRGL